MARILYKYLPPSRSTVLHDGLIRFSQVAALNDPFESIAMLASDSTVDKWMSRVDSTLREVSRNYGGSGTDESDRELEDRWRKKMHRYVRWRVGPERAGRDVMSRTNAAIGVLSLSRTAKSVLMWSHYAQDHTGFVIGFDESDPFFSIPDFEGNPSRVYDVLYQRRRTQVDLGHPDWYEHLLCQKAIAWKYEKEARIFRAFTADSKKGIDAKGLPVHLLQIPRTGIRKVILGANSSPGLQAELSQYLLDNAIKAELYKARVSKRGFGLIFDRLAISSYRPRQPHRHITYKFPQFRTLLPIEIDEIAYLENASYFEFDFPRPSVALIANLP